MGNKAEGESRFLTEHTAVEVVEKDVFDRLTLDRVYREVLHIHGIEDPRSLSAAMERLFPNYDGSSTTQEDIDLIKKTIFVEDGENNPHWVDHGARVAILADVVGGLYGFSPRERHLLGLAGFYHDAERKRHFTPDVGHGVLVAQRIEEPLFFNASNTILRRKGGDELNPGESILLQTICEHHETPWGAIQDNVRKQYGSELGVFKIVDGFDRSRVPNRRRWFDRERVKSRGLDPDIAIKFYESGVPQIFTLDSMREMMVNGRGPSEAVITSARRIGLIRPESERGANGNGGVVFSSRP